MLFSTASPQPCVSRAGSRKEALDKVHLYDTDTEAEAEVQAEAEDLRHPIWAA
jgi:hypothetical protein